MKKIGILIITLMIVTTGFLSGCTNQQQSKEIQNKSPAALFIGEQIAPLVVNFSGFGGDLDGEITSYAWDFGDGFTSSEQNPLHTYTNASTYNITLTVTDDDGAKGTYSTIITCYSNFTQNESIPDNNLIISKLKEQGVEVNTSMVDTAKKYSFEDLVIDGDGIQTDVFSTDKPTPANEIAKLETEENLSLKIKTTIYSSIVIAADEEYRAAFPHWKDKTWRFVEKIDDYFIDKFGLNFVVVRFEEYDSDDLISDPLGLFYEARREIDKKDANIMLAFSNQYFGFVGGVAERCGDDAMIFYNIILGILLMEDNIIQHELSHLFGALDHKCPDCFFHWCIMSYFWFPFTHSWCNECLNNMMNYISQIQMNHPPEATISVEPTSGVSPLLVTFNGSGTDYDGDIISYNWDFGDGSSSNQQNPSHTFDTGVYTVTLTVTDNDGAKGTSSTTITATTSDEPAEESSWVLTDIFEIRVGESHSFYPPHGQFKISWSKITGESPFYATILQSTGYTQVINSNDNSGEQTYTRLGVTANKDYVLTANTVSPGLDGYWEVKVYTKN